MTCGDNGESGGSKDMSFQGFVSKRVYRRLDGRMKCIY